MKITKALLFSGLSAAGLFSQAPAFAQNASSEATSDEIVVTAQRREQDLQDVPVAVSAIDGDTLEALNVDGPGQLASLVPSFDSNAFGVSIRGVGTSTFSTSIELSVSTVVDEVVLGRPEMARGAYYDLERIEVLRGPQGMLFGKNASAGVVSLVTRNANPEALEFLGNFSVGEEGYEDHNVTLNLPIHPNAAIRVGAYTNRYDGPIENVPDGRDFNGNEEWGARARFLWDITPSLTFRLNADYTEQDNPGMWTPYLTRPAAAQQIGLATVCGITASASNRQTCIDGANENLTQTEALSGYFDWVFGGGFTLSSITAGRRADFYQDRDSDSLPINILNRNINDTNLDQFSQEFRLISPEAGRLRYTLGLYYFTLENEQYVDQAGTLGFALPPGFLFNSTVESTVESESAAVFGHAEFDVSDSLTLIAGGRLTRDEVSLDFRQFTQPGFLAFTTPVAISQSIEEDNFSWRLGAQYDLSDDVMFYAVVSRGYKGPGFNQTAISNTTTSQLVRPEIPTNYEVGLRSEFFEGALVANVTAFSQTFEDYQAQIVDRTVTPSVFRTVNAGELETVGVEADVTAILPPGIVLTASLAYLDATYGDFGEVSCFPGQTLAQGCVLVAAPATFAYDPSGDNLAGASEWRSTVTAYYERPLTASLEGFIRADYNWRSDFNLAATGDPTTVVEAYGVLNGSVGIMDTDGGWRLSLWGRNLTDEDYPFSIFNTPFGSNLGGDYSQVPTIENSRRYGVALSVRY
ncbi:MAG: TonB-dependent receptor [Terricaulis sp.]